MRFRPEQHLRRPADFQRVRNEGKRFDCGAFTVWHATRSPQAASLPSDSESVPALARLGVVASRAAVGDAVRRNRAKRRLREVFRHHQQLAPVGHDVLLVARHSLNRLPYAEIERKFVDACGKIFPSVPPPPTA